MISEQESVAVEAAVQGALKRRSADRLNVLGFGEITVVVGWPTDLPTHAIKRLPPVAERSRLERYAALIDEYCTRLGDRGVTVAPHTSIIVPAERNTWTLHVAQPLYPGSSLVTQLMRTDGPEVSGQVDAIVDHVMCADERLGIDAQLTNWVIDHGHPTLIDTTTPMMRDDDGTFVLDIDMMLTPFPAVARPTLRRYVVPDILARYHDPRSIAIDIAANLHREALADWIPAVVRRANTHLGEPIRSDEVEAYYRTDAKRWGKRQRVKRINRAWTTTIRRRTYPVLLPGPITR
jgi:Family of unknown function (DUF6206)